MFIIDLPKSLTRNLPENLPKNIKKVPNSIDYGFCFVNKRVIFTVPSFFKIDKVSL
jgi:FPC/CPF motif-containing protein YcgG